MESKHLTYFKVENFKRFEFFEMENLGQFNLIVGDNNVGKTTVLESLLIDQDTDSYLLKLELALLFRGIKSYNSGTITSLFEKFFLNAFSKKRNINFNFIFNNGKNSNIVIEPIHLNQLSNSELEEIKTELLIKQPSELLRCQVDKVNKFAFKKENGMFTPEYVSIPFLPNIPLLDTENIEDSYSKYILVSNALKKIFLENISVFIKDIEDIEISKLNDNLEIVVWTKGNDKNIPLKMYGDGTIKLFRILLAIEAFHGNRVLIDEIDTGIHHSRFKKFLKTILLAAKRNNVQIFATTHSKECLQYFKEVLEEEALKDLQKDTRCIRLIESENDAVKSFTYDFERFQFAVEQENELR